MHVLAAQTHNAKSPQLNDTPPNISHPIPPPPQRIITGHVKWLVLR